MPKFQIPDSVRMLKITQVMKLFLLRNYQKLLSTQKADVVAKKENSKKLDFEFDFRRGV